MKNPFVLCSRFYRNLKTRLARRKANRKLLQTLRTFGWLEKLFESGQLTFDYDHHRLFITKPVASLLMSKGADAWVQSVHNIYNYVHFLQTQQAWDEYMQKEELAAVRDAMKRPAPDPSLSGRGVDSTKQQNKSRPSIQGGDGGGSLTRQDIDRIRLARRQQIAFSDMEPPKVEPFEFFIIPLSTEAKVEPLAVGYYDPNSGEMDVATWDDVAQLLKDGHQ